MESALIGYVRKSNAGKALKISIDKSALNDAETFTSKDGREFVQGVINLDKIGQVIDGTRLVTSLSHIVDDTPAPEEN